MQTVPVDLFLATCSWQPFYLLDKNFLGFLSHRLKTINKQGMDVGLPHMYR